MNIDELTKEDKTLVKPFMFTVSYITKMFGLFSSLNFSKLHF